MILIKRNKILFFVLLLAAFLRLYRLPAYMEFLGDQGRDAIIVRRFLTQGDLMFIGPQTSVGNMYLGPWYYYLMAPALFLAGFNPVGPAVMVALLGVATVWLVWKVGQEWFDEKTGLIAALLMAISPVIIYYSIFSWNPNIMPFFALLSIWFLWRIWQKNEYQKLPFLAVSLAMVLNSHYLGLLLLPVAGIFWFWGLKKTWATSKKSPYILHTISCLLIFFILMSPLLAFDLKHNFSNLNAFKQFFTIRQTTVNLKFYKGLLKLPQIFNQLYAQLLVRQDFWPPVYILLPLLLLGFWRQRKNKAMILIAVWLLIGILGLANYKQHIYAHYFGFLWPGAVLLLAVSLSSLSTIAKWLILLLFCYLSLMNWHLWQQAAYQLKRAKIGANEICYQVSKNQVENYNLVNLASYNDFRALAYRYFLLQDCPVKPMTEAQYPETKNLFVIWEDQKKYPDPVNTDIWEIQSRGGWKIKEEFKAFDTKILWLK